MATMYYEKDADLKYLKGKRVAVIGYGSQGRAQSRNLKDSGIDVVVGLRPGSKSWALAEKEGLAVATVEEAAKDADIVQILIWDESQGKVYREQIAQHLSPGKTLMFSHGFNITYRQIVPPEYVDVIMIAPKSPGLRVREMYEEGMGVPCLLAVEQDYSGNAKQTALAYAMAIGCARAGVLETTFKEETETDLFGEQTILCGGVSSLIKAAFDTLVAAGYQPEVAYFECCHELKLITDLINEGGLTKMRNDCSDTAEFGDYCVGDTVINEDSKKAMQKALDDIQNGEFAKRWLLENQVGRPYFYARRAKEQNTLLERVGREVRSMIPWLQKKNEPEIVVKKKV
ncbi:MAG: ketol-acid reductoisomerase [Candidatus Methanofastidiosa archaeon]|nr:ketol-acid reductoisomerase [Candidatus Methanofastidiosa archaeon]